MTWILHCNWFKENLNGPLPAMLFPTSCNMVRVIYDFFCRSYGLGWSRYVQVHHCQHLPLEDSQHWVLVCLVSGLLLHLLLEALFHMLFVWTHCNVHVPVQYVCSLPNDSPLSCVHSIWNILDPFRLRSQCISQKRIAPARDPRQRGEQKVNHTSNSSYSMEQRGTVTGQVRHYRNCSSRNLFWHKHKNLISGRLRKFQKIVKEVPSIWRT